MTKKTKPKNITRDFKKLLNMAYSDYKEKELKIKMGRAIDLLRDSVLNVIEQYNTGQIERYSGDYKKRLADNASYNRNMPLIDSGDYYKSIMSELDGNIVDDLVGRVFSEIKYAHKLEFSDFESGYEGYRVFAIALMNVKQDIIKIFKQ